MAQARPARLGFSLIEIVAAVAILLVLAGVVAPALGGKVAKARDARASADMKEVSEAFNTYRADTGTWPSNGRFDPSVTGSDELVLYKCLYARTAGIENWRGPYLTAGYADGPTMQAAYRSSDTPDGPSRPNSSGGLLDPWGHAFGIHWFARGYDGSQGAIVIACNGADGVLDSSAEQIARGRAADDDLLTIVTRKL